MADTERVLVIGAPTGHAFGGLGFHNFEHLHDVPEDMMENTVMRRWRDLNPSFCRLTHTNSAGQAGLKALAHHMKRLRSTGTEFYLTTWDPPVTEGPEGMERYAEGIGDALWYLVREQGVEGLTTYCCANELSQAGMGWGSMTKDLPLFRDFHAAIHKALDRRGLGIRLLATDASPVGNWWTLDWAAANMDDITGAYGGHHYFNEIPPDSPETHPWFHARVADAVALADSKGKPFIIGEFGPKQNTRHPEGMRLDACDYWGTDMEPMVGVQVCEAAMAATSAGAYATAYWTFMDFPDLPGSYQNKWGTFKWSGDDFGIRPVYHAYGLLTRAFRGGGTVLRTECGDPLVRSLAVSNPDGSGSVAIVNRNPDTVAVSIAGMVGGDATACMYDPTAPPAGDVEGLRSGESLGTVSGTLRVDVPANALVVVTVRG